MIPTTWTNPENITLSERSQSKRSHIRRFPDFKAPKSQQHIIFNQRPFNLVYSSHSSLKFKNCGYIQEKVLLTLQNLYTVNKPHSITLQCSLSFGFECHHNQVHFLWSLWYGIILFLLICNDTEHIFRCKT